MTKLYEILFIVLIIALFTAPTLTFGHCSAKSKYEDIEQKYGGCLIATIAFPLYWSEKLFEWKEANQ